MGITWDKQGSNMGIRWVRRDKMGQNRTFLSSYIEAFFANYIYL
jgi:hypothetical protein